MDVTAAKMIGAGLATIAMLGVGIGLGNIFGHLVDAVGRNPSAAKDISRLGFIGMAATESIALLAFVVAMMILR